MLEQYKLSVFKQGMDSYEILNLKKKKKERKDFVFPWNGIIKHKKKKGRFQNSFDFIFRMSEIRIFKSIERKQIEERID